MRLITYSFPFRWLIFGSAFLHGALAIHAPICPGDFLFFPGLEVGRVRPSRLNELSGMAASRRNPGALWVHNDGPIDEIFVLNTAGRILATFTVNTPLNDVEDAALGPGPNPGVHYIYIGDLGNATGARTTVTIVRAPEPEIDLDPANRVEGPLAGETTHVLAYPDSAYDAEALLVDPLSGDLFIITKQEGFGRVFKATQQQLAAGGTVPLQFVVDIPLGLVSGGDISPDGSQIVLRREDAALLWRRRPEQTITQALAATSTDIPVIQDEPNGESLAFAADGSGYYTVSEGEDQPIYFFRRNNTLFAPGQEIGVAEDDQLIELSGIASSRRNLSVLWVHNDGLTRRVFALSTNGNLLATFEFSQDLIDFEDIAVGPGPVAGIHYLYGADIGDNADARAEIHIFRVPEPEVPSTPLGGVASFTGETIITLQYPDGPHNAEALLIDSRSGDLFIVSKESGGHRLYHASRGLLVSGQPVILTFVHSGSFELVSGGDISPDGGRIILRREDAAAIWVRSAEQTVIQALATSGSEIPVIGPPTEPNGEAITFDSSGRGYFTISEGANAPIYFFAAFAPPTFAQPPVRISTGWQLMIRGCEGSAVRVEASANLVTWQEIGTVTPSSGNTPFLDTASGFDERFYRLVLIQ